MWRLDNIGVSYRLADGGLRHALNGISFSISPGERIAIVGPNGSGKSTLAQVVAGVIAPTVGDVHRPQAVHTDSRSDLAAENSDAVLLFQDPDDNLIGETPGDDIALSLEFAGRAEGRLKTACGWLAEAGLDHLAARASNQLSGGEKQTVALISAIATGHPLIVLDEPTSHLDPPARRALLQRILGTRPAIAPNAAESAIVLITQYREEAEQFPRIVELQEGRILFDGPATDWTPADAGADTKRIDRRRPEGGRLLLQATGLTQSPGAPQSRSCNLLTDISLSIHAGDTIALTGPMGAGKSTLAYHLAGVMGQDDGCVVRLSSDHPVVMIQFPERQLFSPTVLEDVRLGCESHGLGDEVTRQRTRGALKQVGLDPDQVGGLSPFVLSGGQRRRVALAAIAACPASIYILDEPTASLDSDGVRRVEDVVTGWVNTDSAVVLISHDIEWLAKVTSRLWVLERGRLVYDGYWEDQAGVAAALSAIGFA